MSFLPFGLPGASFIHASRGRVTDELVAWGNEEAVGRGTRIVRKQLSLGDGLACLGERSYHPSLGMVISLKGGWTAFVDNQVHGVVPNAEMHNTCQRLLTEAFYVGHVPKEVTNSLETTMFWHYRHGNNESSVVKRGVVLVKDGRWKFTEYGEPADFEELQSYQSSKKTERLTIELLKLYGGRLGVHFWDEHAYMDDGVLLRSNDFENTGPKTGVKNVLETFKIYL